MNNFSKNDFCACILSFGAVPKLPDVVESVSSLHTVIFNPMHSWWFEDMKDYTSDALGDKTHTLVRGDWLEESHVRNLMVRYANACGFKFVIILDSDEVLDSVDSLVEEVNNSDIATAYSCRLVDYGQGGEILPKRGHQPVMMIDARDENAVFTDIRNVSCGVSRLSDVKIHHYSYDSPEEFKYKLGKDDGDIWPPKEHEGVI